MSVSSRPRSAVVISAILAVLASTLALVAVSTPAEGAVIRPFSKRFDADLAGSTRLVGNTNMTCSKTLGANKGKCAAAQAGAADNNNSYTMEYVDIDNDGSTFNSSSANLAMPAGATVVRADLTWGGRIWHKDAKKKAPNEGLKNRVKFKVEASAPYQDIVADTVDQYHDNKGKNDNGIAYSAIANVTSLIKSAANGTYTVGNIQAASEGPDLFAGWSLIVVYASQNEPVRSITVFNGFADVRDGQGVDIPVSGFRTPPDGVVKSQVGFVSFEGDRGLQGDTLSLKSPSKGTSQLSDSSRAPTNFFSSFINQPPGTPVTTKSPNFNNQLGFDIGRIDASGKLGNGDTSAVLKATTNSDAYYPTAFTFEAELYTPKLVPTKTALDVNGGVLKPGDTVRYTVTTQNTGDDGGTNARLLDTLPTNADYVSGSAKVNGTVAGGASVDSGVLTVPIGNIGAAGKPNSGPWVITYDVVVKSSAQDGEKVINSPKMAVNSVTGNVPLEFPGNKVELTVSDPRANLSLTKTAADKFTAGSNGTYTLKLKNNGPQTAQGPLVVTDELPSGQTFVSATGSGWSCTNTGQNVRCVTSAGTTLANGAEAPEITVTVKVPADVADGSTQQNTANGTSSTTGTPGEGDKTVTVERHHDLVMQKRHSGAMVPGTNGTWRLSVSNKGPSVAGVVPGKPITVTDALPSGLTYVSGTGPDWTCNASGQDVTCTYAKVLAPGEVAPDILLTAKLATDIGDFSNTSSVTTTDGTEDNPGDNTSTDNVTVTPQVDGSIAMTEGGTPTKGGPPVPVYGDTMNNGPSTLPAGTVVTSTYKIPSGASLAGITSSGAWNCTPTTGTGPVTVTCTQTLNSAAAPGTQFDRVEMSVSLAADAPDSVTVDGQISVPGDIDPTNDNAHIVLLAVVDADIQITTNDDLTLVAGGPSKQATFTVKNNGPSQDPGDFTVTFPIPSHLTAVASAGSPWSCSTASGLVTCTLADKLDPNASVELDLDISAPDPSTTPRSNTLPTNVTSPANDSNLLNNHTLLPIKIVANADLGVEKTASPGTIHAGEEVTYTLTLKNWGPSVASLSTINDTVPAGFTITDVTAGTGASCSNTATALECTAEDLDPDKSVEVTVKAKAGAGMSAGTKTNTVTVTGETDQGDDDHPNTDDADVTVDQLSNLEVKKDLVKNDSAHCTASGSDPVVAGTNVCYEITVTNNGPSDAVGIDMTDTLPMGLIYIAANGSGWTCDSAVSCTTDATVGVGASAPKILVVGYLDATSTGTLKNTAKATPKSPGPEATGNRENDITPQVDLQLTHSTEQPEITAGGTWTSTINVQNNGPSNEPGPIKVEITLGPDQEYQSAEGSGWNCDRSGNVVTCTTTNGAAPGDKLPPITLITKPGVDATQALASSKVTGTIEDFNLSNNEDSTNTQVKGSADLEVVKKVSGSSKVLPGSTVTFTMKITNHGPSSAPATRVTDMLPKGLSFSSSTPPPCIPDEVSAAIVCNVGTLTPHASTTVTLKAKVTGQPGKITNTATVASSNNDPNPKNNTSKVTITVYKKPQEPVKKPPKKIKGKGTTVIYKVPPKTNAGKKAKLSVSCSPRSSRSEATETTTRGDVRFCQVIRLKGGGYKVKTFGKPVTVKVTLTAPATTTHYAMKKVYTYKVN